MRIFEEITYLINDTTHLTLSIETFHPEGHFKSTSYNPVLHTEIVELYSLQASQRIGDKQLPTVEY